MRLLLFALIFFFGQNCLAAKYPWKTPQDQQKWYWTMITSQPNTPDNVILVDFTKLEKIQDGSIVYPYTDYDKKNNKFITSVSWNKADCSRRESYDLGNYSNGAFAFGLDRRYPEGSIGQAALNMICGIVSEDGDIIYGVGGVNANGSIVPYGVMYKDIKVSSADKNKLEVKNYSYNAITGKTLNADNNIYDCLNKTFSHSSGKLFFTEQDLGIKWKYALDFVCNYKKIGSANKSINSNIIINNLSEIKEKCTSIGFKPGTEKFGNCVLDLNK